MSAISLPAVILCLTLVGPIKWLLKQYFGLKLEFKGLLGERVTRTRLEAAEAEMLDD